MAGWMDRLTRKMSQTESVTGRPLNSQSVESAVYGGLQSDLEMSMKSGMSARAIQSQEKTEANRLAAQSAQYAEQNAISREGLADARERSNLQMSMLNRQLDLQEDKQSSDNIGSIVKGAITYGPKIAEGAAGAYGYIKDAYDLSSATHQMPALNLEDSGALASASSFGAGAATTESAFGGAYSGASITSGTLGTSEAVGGAFSEAYSSAFGTTASESVASWSMAGEPVASGIALASEGAVAATFSSLGQATITHEMAVASSTGAMIAEQSIFASLAPALSAIGTVMPVFGAATMLGMFVPEVAEIMAPVNDVITSVVEAVGDFFSDIGDSVICTELHRQGYITLDVYFLETLARRRFIDDDVHEGYYRLFAPVAKKMRTSKLLTNIMRPFGVAVAQELASKMDKSYKSSLLGKMILKIGSPICKLFSKKEEKELVWTL